MNDVDDTWRSGGLLDEAQRRLDAESGGERGGASVRQESGGELSEPTIASDRLGRLRAEAIRRVVAQEVKHRYGQILHELVSDGTFFTLMNRVGLTCTETTIRTNDNHTTTQVTTVTAPSLIGVAVTKSGLELTFAGVLGQGLDNWTAARSALRSTFAAPLLTISETRSGQFVTKLNDQITPT
ncbi:hypothetical protein ACNQVK_02425 [Mycobacterium sp. 134]|uniref:hypothetical protein n=1 Tax=Mycobacterium sp. 134 TaxID=3400425 RepID=UPI003AAC383B